MTDEEIIKIEEAADRDYFTICYFRKLRAQKKKKTNFKSVVEYFKNYAMRPNKGKYNLDFIRSIYF